MPGILPESFANAAIRAGTDFCRQLRDALLPASCLLCGADSEDLLCLPCAGELSRLSGPCCPQCAETTTHGERCGRCLHHPPHFDATLALHPYHFPVDQLLHAFKYGGQLAPGAWFGRQLANLLAPLAGNIDAMIPMPLHPLRLRERGFNQAVELARPVKKTLRCPLLFDACQRSRSTRPQAELAHQERLANVRGAFACDRDFSGQHLLLIDDVMTTGATLDECARTLKLHGATKVTVAVVARALRHG